MKWLLVAGLAIFLVIVCVVYLRIENPPKTNRHVFAPPIAIKPAKAFSLEAGKPGPIDISGPLKDRALVQWVLPEYPEWAEEKGVGGVVRMHIRAGPDGLVKSFIKPEQLSGEPRLDQLAEDALHQWQFEEKPNAVGVQWGIVTVRFSLLPKGQESDAASLRGILLAKSASDAWECTRLWVGDVEKRLVYICKLKKNHQPAAEPADTAAR